MKFGESVSKGLVGAVLFMAASAPQAAVVTAAGQFDLTTLSLSGGFASVAASEYEADVLTPPGNNNVIDTVPVSLTEDVTFLNGSVQAQADVADLDPSAITAQVTAFDAGLGAADAAYTIAYEIAADGPVSFSVDYSALYDLDGSAIADILVSLSVFDSLSGAFDEAFLLTGDPDFDFGTLTMDFDAFTGDTGVITLFASAVVETGVDAQIPLPSTLFLFSLGLFAAFRAKKQ